MSFCVFFGMKDKEIILNLGLTSDETDDLIASRSSAEPILPELVKEEEVRKPEDYNRFKDVAEKNQFRNELLTCLRNEVEKNYPEEVADTIITEFQKLTEEMDKNGAVIFGNMIDLANFESLISNYTRKLSDDGSKSWIHSYLNIGNHPDFLTDQKFSGAFVHPLLLALIAYAAGGPIRIVDARGKDAEPLAVQAQDNMLHIDNTPFRKEFKVIVTWERGKASGPKGQNFVFIPGTHKGVRNCQVNDKNQAWSVEDASIFINDKAVQNVFDLQQKVLGHSPTVVEATHPDMPLTTLFEAGALVHHRYRTKEKNIPRSCVICAFHRAKDNPGQFLSTEHLDKVAQPDSLMHLLMGNNKDNTQDKFLNAIRAESKMIFDKILEISGHQLGTEVVPYNSRTLSSEELEQWKKTVTSAPKVEDIKIKSGYFNLGDKLTHDLLTEMMKYDKHGPLDLILYGDGHEEIRKWARNRIREMPLTRLEARLNKFEEWDLHNNPNTEQLLTIEQLRDLTTEMVAIIDRDFDSLSKDAYLDPNEKISKRDAVRSIKELLLDLGEAIMRCSTRQTFLSTSLFILLASDELSRLMVGPDKKPPGKLLATTKQLLENYVSTYVLIAKQIDYQKQAEKSIGQQGKSVGCKSNQSPRFFSKSTENDKAKEEVRYEHEEKQEKKPS